jgi:hypothetical protein
LCWDDKETYCKTAIHTGLMTAGEFEDRIESRCSVKSHIQARYIPAISGFSRTIRIANPRWCPR